MHRILCSWIQSHERGSSGHQMWGNYTVLGDVDVHLCIYNGLFDVYITLYDSTAYIGVFEFSHKLGSVFQDNMTSKESLLQKLNCVPCFTCMSKLWLKILSPFCPCSTSFPSFSSC